MKAPETDEDFIQWYEDCWADRDEVEYPKMFGAIDEGVFTLDQTDAIQAWIESDIAQVEEADPNWVPWAYASPHPARTTPTGPM